MQLHLFYDRVPLENRRRKPTPYAPRRSQMPKPDRLESVWRLAAEEGWERDPHSQPGKERWRLPGTAFCLRANWDMTTVYRLVDHRAHQQKSVPSDALGMVRLLLQRTRLEAKRSIGR
jgi:hypothetical protein